MMVGGLEVTAEELRFCRVLTVLLTGCAGGEDGAYEIRRGGKMPPGLWCEQL